MEAALLRGLDFGIRFFGFVAKVKSAKRTHSHPVFTALLQKTNPKTNPFRSYLKAISRHHKAIIYVITGTQIRRSSIQAYRHLGFWILEFLWPLGF
jgi:hypothetical protein